MQKYPMRRRGRRRPTRMAAGFALATLGAAAALPAGAAGAAALAAQADAGCLPGHAGFLRAQLRGASPLQVDWSGVALSCDGGVRPDGRGIRVTFAGAAGGHHLRFIFGIDAPPREGAVREVPTNLTLIFEGEHRLYATRGPGQCTVDRLRLQRATALPPATRPSMRVSARGFCIGPATALEDASGTAADDQLFVSRFDFVGLLYLPRPDQ